MQDVLQGLMWVALGSVLGGPARYFVSGLVGRHIGETFPWGTVVVNVTGAFVIGLLAAVAAIGGVFPMPAAWHFAVTGFVGTYTTVSSFSLQTLALVRDGQILRAGGNVLLSLVLCLSAVAFGYVAGAAALGTNAP
jgi:fluoride exporter